LPKPAGSWWKTEKMKFDELDTRMRVFEMAHDDRVLPGIYMAARLDGRSFTRLRSPVLSTFPPSLSVKSNTVYGSC
jgi:hypothetical protein